MKTRLRDIAFMLLWMFGTLVMGTLFLPCLLSRRATHWFSRCWARATLWLLDHICGIRSHLRGYTFIVGKPAIYAAKHQSTWDTIILNLQLRNPAFVLKRELYLIPIFGWYLWRSGQIAINRRDGKKALETMIAQAKRYAEQGRSIVIFPEGTRRAIFAPPAYKLGVARVSEATQLPVVPVALNAGRVWPRHPVAKRSGSAVVEFLPAMPPAGSAREPWLQDLENRIESATARLLKEA